MIGPRSRLYLTLALAVAILFAAGLASRYGTHQFAEDSRWVGQSYEVLTLIEESYTGVVEAESAQRGFLLTGDPDYEKRFFDLQPQVRAHTERLRTAVAPEPLLHAQATALSDAIDQRLSLASDVLRRYRENGFEAAREEVSLGNGAAVMREIAALASRMQESEGELLRERSASSERSLLVLQVISIGGIALGGGILVLVFVGLLHENRERRRAEHAANRASESLAASVERLQALTDETRELSHYAGMLQSCRNSSEAFRLTADSFRRLLPGHGGTVYLMRSSSDLAERVFEWGQQPAPSDAGVAAGDCWALRRGRAHRVADARAEVRCAHVHAPPGDRPGVETLCLPLVAQGATLGFVYLSGRGSRREIETSTALVEQLGLALSNLQLQETLRTQSIRDPLTGLFNRRYLEESMPRELARASRRGRPLALMMVDVDHFKSFNDRHGHDGGDALLREFGRLLQSQLRPEDIACRFGGEEFTLILPETDCQTAERRAEELRAAVEALHHHHGGPAVTASFGIACHPQHAQSTIDLIRLADRALYRAKAAGRNRVCTAETEPAPAALERSLPQA